MLVCLLCERSCVSLQSLKTHLWRSHGVKHQQYLIEQEYEGRHPLCGCGCGKEVSYFKGKFREYIQGHFLREKKYLHTEAVRSKRKNTNFIKYGGFAPACSSEIREKIKKTNSKRSHKESTLTKERKKEAYTNKSDAEKKLIKEKREKTNLSRFGTKNVFSSLAVREKIKNSNLQKYGFEYCTKNNEIREKISATKRITYEEVANICLSKKYLPFFNYSTYKDNRQSLKFSCLKHNVIFETCIFNIQQVEGAQCPRCKITGTSLEEGLIYDFLNKDCDIKNIIRNTRKIISPKELDIYLPDKNFGIEYHGLYWHSEAFENFKEKELHFSKFKLCESKGIKLFQFYEDEWRDKQDICKSMIKNALGMANTKISARSCEIGQDLLTEREFFNDNHLQGFVKSCVSFFLMHEGVPVFSISLRKPFTKKEDGCLEIARVASRKGHLVRGGFSKLLKRAICWAKDNGFKKIISYSDCRYSSGGLYEKNGFIKSKHTGLDYYYTDLKRRFNRFKYRAQDGKTEKQVALENSVYKIYGAGNYLWECNL